MTEPERIAALLRDEAHRQELRAPFDEDVHALLRDAATAIESLQAERDTWKQLVDDFHDENTALPCPAPAGAREIG